MKAVTFYAPTFLDESMTFPDKRGLRRPTGKLSGFVITRRFSKKGSKFRAERGLVPFSWGRDTPKAKITALAKAIEGMEELPGLDENPPLNWIPETVKEKFNEQVS